MQRARLGVAVGLVVTAACVGCNGSADGEPGSWQGPCVCPNPPETDWQSQCAEGSTFQAHLVGECGGCDPATGECLYQPIEVACPDPGVLLPQDHTYQIVLRDYLATLGEADFEVALEPLSYDAALPSTPDELFRTWILARGTPAHDGLRVPASLFTLEAIEQPGVKMRANDFIEPTATAWWTMWDFPGNPYFGSAAARRRALVASAVDMMMLDRTHDEGNYTGNVYLSGTTVWLAYPLYALRDEVPVCVRAAYEMGLRRMFDKLEQWDGNNGNNDMGMPGHVGMSYVAAATADPELLARAQAESREEMDDHYHEAGYLDHGANGFGFDGSYEGISLYFLAWAGLATVGDTGYEFLRQQIEQFSRLKAYLTLPEPDEHTFWSPTHFSNATAAGSANDQWSWDYRDFALAMISDEAKYLTVGGRNGRSLTLPAEAEMREAIEAFVLDESESLTTPITDVVPEDWSEQHWSTGLNYAAAHYRPGFYEALQALHSQDSSLLRPPFLRDGDFIETFDDEFTAVKLAGYGAIVHSGRLARGWPEPTLPFGFGGGALSAFWTPATGPVLLGLQRGSQNESGPHPNTWEEWRLWPTHAVSGVSADGKPFSSARILYPEATITTDDATADVVVSGVIGSSVDDGLTAPDDALAGTVQYSRSFHLDASGVAVETTLSADGSDQVLELVETLPVFYRDARVQPDVPDPVITLQLAGGGSVAASSSLQADVTSIRIERFDGAVVVEFVSPQHVRLAPELWQIDYQIQAVARTLLIDLLDGASGPVPFPSKTLQYTIQAAQ